MATHCRCTSLMAARFCTSIRLTAIFGGPPAAGAVHEAGAGVAVVLADRQQELLVAHQAEHAHVTGQAVDLRQLLQVGPVLEAQGVQRIDALGGDGVGHLAVGVEGAAAHGLVRLAELQLVQLRGCTGTLTSQDSNVFWVYDPPLQFGRRPHLLGEDAVEGAGVGHLVVHVGHLELVAQAALGPEVRLQLDVAAGVADVDDRHLGELGRL